MEWIYKKTVFKPDAELPNGDRPWELIQEWLPWIVDCLRLLDADGAYMHWKYPGSYSEQPAADMDIYDVIRGKWNDLKNEEMENKYGNIKLPKGK